MRLPPPLLPAASCPSDAPSSTSPSPADAAIPPPPPPPRSPPQRWRIPAQAEADAKARPPAAAAPANPPRASSATSSTCAPATPTSPPRSASTTPPSPPPPQSRSPSTTTTASFTSAPTPPPPSPTPAPPSAASTSSPGWRPTASSLTRQPSPASPASPPPAIPPWPSPSSAAWPPRLRTYGPALFAYCDAADADGAKQVEAHMDASGVVPEEPELAALLRVNADKARADEVYRLLHRTRALVRQLCETTTQVVEAWFRSDAAAEAGIDKWDPRKVKEGVVKGGGGWHGQGWLGKGQWSVGRSQMGKDGTCQRCGERLVCIDIDPSETENFANSLSELASKREVKEGFMRFQHWLRRHGPFDAVIDAVNVGLYNSKAFSFSQVNSVVNAIQRITKSKKLPLIILHGNRVNGGPAKTPYNQKILESWRNARALYATPPGSNDD